MQDVKLLGAGGPGLLGRACGTNTLVNLAVNQKLKSKILSANKKPEIWRVLTNEKPES